MKKPFKETAVGKFLKSKGFNAVVDAVGSVVPGVKILNDVKEMVIGSPEYKALPESDQQMFLQLHDQEMAELDMILDDKQNARLMYEKKSDMADHIAKRISDWNLPIVFLLMAALIACTVLLKDNVLLALISSSIGGVIVNLFTERQTLITFFFGSSAGSKEKQQVLLNASSQTKTE